MTIISSDNSVLITKPDTCDFDIRVNPNLLDFLIYTQNSSTLLLSGNGLFNSKLQGSVKISTNPSNILSTDSTGLLVIPPSLPTVTDEFVKVTSSDTTAGTLNTKLSAGTGISFTILNPGANEQLRINNTLSISSLGGISGSGTTNRISKFTGSASIGNSLITDNGVTVLIDGQIGTLFSTALYNNAVFMNNSSTGLGLRTVGGNGSGALGYAFKVEDYAQNARFLVNGDGTTYIYNLSTSGVVVNNSSGLLSTSSGTGIMKMSGGVVSYITDNSSNWDSAYTNRITSLTTTGTSGPATLVGNVLNIPQYSAVSTVSVTSTNGFSGTVSNPTTTPAITISTTITGLLKGNGTAISAAVAGTDYQSPITLTTTGTSGAATLIGNTLNIPQYTGGSGTVTSASVVSANGFGGSVATATTTPAITITTSVTGILKGNGTAVSAAIAGTDYQIPITASNGMSYSSGTVTLGGSLTNNTTITGGTYYMAFLGSIGTLNQSNTPFSAASTITTTGTETAQYIMSGVSGALVVNNASTFTPYTSSKHGAISGSVYKDSAGNWAGPLNAIYGCVQVAGTGNVTTTVAIRAYKVDLTSGRTFGGTITNAVGVYIDDISTSDVSASITNRYSIYQIGASDVNYLNGFLRMENLPVYADNAAASSLPPGTFYRTATGEVKVRY